MKIIFHNDDIGLTYGLTDAVINSYKSGLTTSTSIRTNGFAYKYAIGLLKKNKNLGLGLHFNLTEGPTHFEYLANSEGKYKYSFARLYYRILSGDKTLLKEIYREMVAQMEAMLQEGLTIDHINSQDHVHMIPQIFDLTCKLAKKYHVSYLRLTAEPFHFQNSFDGNVTPMLNTNIIKWGILNTFSISNRNTLRNYNLKTVDAFYGVLQTNHMTGPAILAAINDAAIKKYNEIEILSHPAHSDKRDIVYTSDFIERYSTSTNRVQEENALHSKKIINMLRKKNINTVSYKNL